MSNHPIIAALKIRLESEREKLATLYDNESKYEGTYGGYLSGHEAATERLMAIVEKSLAVIEFYSWIQPTQFPEGYYEPHYSPGVGGHDRFGTKAREFLSLLKDSK